MSRDQVSIDNLERATKPQPPLISEAERYEAAQDYYNALKASEDRNERWRAISLAAIDATFIATIAVASSTTQAATLAAWLHGNIIMIPLAVMATNRTARTITYNGVMEWLRKPLIRVVHDSSGAGDDVEPRDDINGPSHAVAELLSCIVCSGTWSALALALLYLFTPVFGTLLIAVLAVAGCHETLVDLQEHLRWNARHQREQAGWMNKVNKDYGSFVAKE